MTSSHQFVNSRAVQLILMLEHIFHIGHRVR